MLNPETIIFASLIVAATGPASAVDAGSSQGADACPEARAQLANLETFKAANRGHPRMHEIDEEIAYAKTALDACLKLRREAAERLAREQEMSAQRERAQEYFDDVQARERDARLKDPAFARARFSALLCYASSVRKKAKEILGDQRRAARAGLGVIDKALVYEYQGEIVVASKVERLARADLKARKLSATSCKAESAEEFEGCIHNARMAPRMSEPGVNEFTETAEAIVEYSIDCTPSP